MSLIFGNFNTSVLRFAALSALLSLFTAAPGMAQQTIAPKAAAAPETKPLSHDVGVAPPCAPAALGSPYIPVDSWIYPAVLRLYSLGFVDSVYLGMRPWTRASLGHMVEQAGARIDDADGGSAADEAQGIYDALLHELSFDDRGPCLEHKGNARIESIYSVARAIGGTPLDDSFHLGSTIVNDYGRPYENGFNNYTGASGYASLGRFVLYVRGEFDGAPSAGGYSLGLAQELSLQSTARTI